MNKLVSSLRRSISPLWNSKYRNLVVVLLVVIALPLTVLVAQKNQDNRQRASEGITDPMVCTFDEWIPAPDWLLGNATVGTFKRSHPDGYWDEEKQEDTEPGPVINAGDEVATTNYKYDLNQQFWRVGNGAKLPVKYDPWNDALKSEFSGRSFSESNWSRFLRVMNDSAYMPEITSKQISTGVLMKYKIMGFVRGTVDHLVDPNGGSTESPGTSETQSRANFAKFLRGDDMRVEATAGTYNNRPSLAKTNVKGEKITIELISRLIGFDVTGLKDELYKVGGSVAEQKAFMIAETASCAVKPTAQPTSTVPVSCEEQLMVPPIGYKKDFPQYTPNHCAAHIANHDPVTKRDELDVCGEYWYSQWCNGNQQNAVYACRGWSQTNSNPVLLYYTNRIYAITTTKGTQGDGGQLAANIAKYGDVRGRRITWNNFMQELKDGKIAYPWEHSSASKSDEEVRNNALQAASTAIFGKPWGAIKEQERMNNCPTTWDNPITPPVTVTQPVTPPVTITPTVDDEQPITDDGENTKDINPKVVKDAKNNVYTTWEADGVVKYSKGTWTGTKYTFSDVTPIGALCATQGCKPAIAVNKEGTKVMIAWAADPKLSIFVWDGTPGIQTGTVGIPMKYPMEFGLEPNIAIDTQGAFHLVANGDNKTKYCKYDATSGTCSETKEFTETFSHPEIAIDSQNNIHIVSSGSNKINYYTRKVDATDFITKQLDNGGNGPQITADTKGNVYIVWSKDFNIQFCKKTINTECALKTINDGQGTNPSVGVTVNDDLVIAYNSANQTIKYVKYTNGAWTNPESFRKQNSVSVDISPLSYDNKLSAVWSSDWDIWHKYFAFDSTKTGFDITLLLDGIGAAGDYRNRSANSGSNKNPNRPSRSIALQLYNDSDTLVHTELGTVSYTGADTGTFKGVVYVNTNLLPKSGHAKVKVDQYLVKNLTYFIIKENEVNTHVPVTLVTGDIDGNNELNLLDYNIIADCYSDINASPRSCSTENKILADLTDDGKVNQFDYNLFIRELPVGKGE